MICKSLLSLLKRITINEKKGHKIIENSPEFPKISIKIESIVDSSVLFVNNIKIKQRKK